MFKNLSQRKTWQKFLMIFCCVISFVPAYLVYAFGFMPANNIAMTIAYILLIGATVYVLFELVSSLTYALCIKFIPNFALAKKEYKFVLRVFVTFRNIILSLVNIIFLYNPIYSVWGLLIAYCITTTIMVVVMFVIMIKTYNLQQYKNLYINRIASIYAAYLVIYLMVGTLVWER